MSPEKAGKSSEVTDYALPHAAIYLDYELIGDVAISAISIRLLKPKYHAISVRYPENS